MHDDDDDDENEHFFEDDCRDERMFRDVHPTRKKNRENFCERFFFLKNDQRTREWMVDEGRMEKVKSGL